MIENLQSSIVWVILSAVVCLLPKNVGSSYAFFQRYYNYFYRILAAISILSTLPYISRMLKFVAIQFCQRIFFQRVSEHQLPWNKLLIKETIFSEQHQLYWKESSYLKQLFFRRKIFFRILSCLEQLLPSNNFS